MLRSFSFCLQQKDGRGSIARCWRGQQLFAPENVIKVINRKLQGWVRYFRVGNSAPCVRHIKDWVEKQVRRHLARACAQGRVGFGWARWTQSYLYDRSKLHKNYELKYKA